MGSVRPTADNADAQSGSREATGIAGLSAVELSAMIRQSPVGDPSVPGALAPYLAGTLGLSAEAYQEWLVRMCEQPDDE